MYLSRNNRRQLCICHAVTDTIYVFVTQLQAPVVTLSYCNRHHLCLKRCNRHQLCIFQAVTDNNSYVIVTQLQAPVMHLSRSKRRHLNICHAVTSTVLYLHAVTGTIYVFVTH